MHDTCCHEAAVCLHLTCSRCWLLPVLLHSWASIPEWETWSLSPQCRRSHLPLGIWQFVPKKGEGFPEDFVFIQNYDEPVNAKY